jgi:hypothetical protein
MMIEIHVPNFDDLDFPKFKNDFWLPISPHPPTPPPKQLWPFRCGDLIRDSIIELGPPTYGHN